MHDNNNLKLLYSEIIQGCSSFLFNGKTYFIKHLNYIDSSDIDIYRSQCISQAMQKGLSLYSERLDHIIKNHSWPITKENRLNEVKDFIINLKHTKSKYTLDKDKKIVDKEIKKFDNEYLDLLIEKNKLIGKTAEQFAERKINEYYIYISIFLDKDCHIPMFSKEEFDELDQITLDKLYKFYNDKMNLFSSTIIKKIALMPLFMNLFVLSDNNAFNFFGKPLLSLTFNQIELFQNGKNFKYILENSKTQPPPEIMSEPDKLMEWFNASENVNKIIESTDNKVVNTSDTETVINAVSIVGAKSKDYEQFGMDNQENNALLEKLKTKGELSWQDLM